MKYLEYRKRFSYRKGYQALRTNKVKTEIKNNNSTILTLIIILIVIFILIFFYIYFLAIIIKKKENYYYSKRKKHFVGFNGENYLTFNHKLNWLAIYDSNKLKGKCADKILLHEYSKQKLGKDICNKIIKIYNSSNEINFDELPDKFVLKTNHGSGYNIIVDNKTNLNQDKAKNQLDKWMKIDYGEFNNEFYYSYIKRKIFVEEFLGNSLKNYKFMCYYGKPKYVYVSIKENHRKYRNFYDMNWNLLDFDCLSQRHPTYIYEKPKLFELMKEYSIKLSHDFKFVRVDLYEIENEVRLGELTFIPMDSYFICKNKEHEIELGKDIITKKTIYDYFFDFLEYIGIYDYLFL